MNLIMLRSFLSSKKNVNEEIMVIDSIFPRKNPMGFRNAEINKLLELSNKINSYTMYPMQAGQNAWFKHGYGKTKEEFRENKKGYLSIYPENRNRIKYLEPLNNYNAKLAYSLFLAETHTLLPFYHKHSIDFVFTLYPGGAFGLDNKGSDKMLEDVFSSGHFKKVITTRNITKKYLLEKGLCKEDYVAEMNGYRQFNKEEVKRKKLYPNEKKYFDICFVAMKYSERGVDKGYDIFIEIAKRLTKKYRDMRFHVVGDFSEKDIDVATIKDSIKFYGVKTPEFLLDFYSGMDIFLSPNRAFKLYEGNFDGFPLGSDAGYAGVAMFITDELSQNTDFTDDKDIKIIDTDVEKVEEAIIHYYTNIGDLYELSRKGQERLFIIFNTEEQAQKRIQLFEEII